MEPLRCCTLSGVDEHTNLVDLARVSRAHPIVEWGVLYSTARMAKDGGAGRYPREGWIREFATEAQSRQQKTALHLCGDSALNFLRGNEDLLALGATFGRVQLNVRADGFRLADDLGHQEAGRAIRDFVVLNGHGTRVILQNTPGNAELCDALRGTPGLDVLFDASAGQGKSPEAWPDAGRMLGFRCGYAGGLGPANVADELPRISAASDHRSYWIDMENKLRNPGDRFDLRACEAVLHGVGTFMMQRAIATGDQLATDRASPTNVDELDGFWLDWWAGLASGYPMMIPPENASKPTYLDRRDGRFEGFEPGTRAVDLKDALDGSDVGCLKNQATDCWEGITPEGDKVRGETREHAMLRAVVIEAFGPQVTANPAHHPELHRHWVGPKLTDEVLPGLLPAIAAGARP